MCVGGGGQGLVFEDSTILPSRIGLSWGRGGDTHDTRRGQGQQHRLYLLRKVRSPALSYRRSCGLSTTCRVSLPMWDLGPALQHLDTVHSLLHPLTDLLPPEDHDFSYKSEAR